MILIIIIISLAIIYIIFKKNIEFNTNLEKNKQQYNNDRYIDKTKKLPEDCYVSSECETKNITVENALQLSYILQDKTKYVIW